MPRKPGTCTVEGCDRPRQGHGLCVMHYFRQRRTGDPLTVGRPGVPKGPPRPPSPCGVDGCDRPRVAHGYCALHARRWRRYGDPSIAAPPTPIRPPVHRGELHPMAKLTWAQVREIRALHAEGGVTATSLAAQYPVSAAQIGLIVAGKGWKEPQPTSGQGG